MKKRDIWCSEDEEVTAEEDEDDEEEELQFLNDSSDIDANLECEELESEMDQLRATNSRTLPTTAWNAAGQLGRINSTASNYLLALTPKSSSCTLVFDDTVEDWTKYRQPEDNLEAEHQPGDYEDNYGEEDRLSQLEVSRF